MQLRRLSAIPAGCGSPGRAPGPFAVWMLSALVAFALAACAGDDVANEYRPGISLHYPVHGDFSGFTELKYSDNPQRGYQYYQTTWPGLIYAVRPWLQVSGGLLTQYT